MDTEIVAPKEEIKAELIQIVEDPNAEEAPIEYKFNDKLITISAGPSASSHNVDLKGVNQAAFNYSVGYFKQGSDYLFGGIYHVSAYRMYGSMDVPGSTPQKSMPVEAQANINLLGVSYRKYAATTMDTSPYLRLDGGLAWTTSGESVMLSPFENLEDVGLGANLGVGLAFKTGFGSINLDIFHTLYAGSKAEELDSGMTNFSLGVMF